MLIDIKTLLFNLTGQAYTISANVLFIDFAGGIEEGLLLSQMWYWQGKAGEGKYFAKTYDDWYREIRVKKKVVMRAAEKFKKMGILKKEVKKFAGSPTVHYMLNVKRAIELLGIFCHNESGENGTMESSENGTMESAEMELSNVPEMNFPLTKNTTKNTNKEREEEEEKKPKKTVVKKASTKPQQTEQDAPPQMFDDQSKMAGISSFLWKERCKNEPELYAKLAKWAYQQILEGLPRVCNVYGKQYTDEQLQTWTEQQLIRETVNIQKTEFTMYGEPIECDTVKHMLNRANLQLRDKGGLDIATATVKQGRSKANNYQSPFK